MPDAVIAVLVLLVAALVLALPGSRVTGTIGHIRVARRRRVLGAILGANVVSLWPALTWHRGWWVGPAAGLAMLAVYLRALLRRARARQLATAIPFRYDHESVEPPVPLPRARIARVASPPGS